MPEQGSEQKVTVRNSMECEFTTADGKVYRFDPTHFWPVFILNLRRRMWRSVLHNLRYDAPRKLLRRY